MDPYTDFIFVLAKAAKIVDNKWRERHKELDILEERLGKISDMYDSLKKSDSIVFRNEENEFIRRRIEKAKRLIKHKKEVIDFFSRS